MTDLFLTLKLLFNQGFTYPYQHKFFLQAAASVNIERITDLHHFITLFLIIIVILVVWLLLILIDNFIYFNKINSKLSIITKKYCDEILIYLVQRLNKPLVTKKLVYTSQVLREVLIMFYYVYPNINKSLLSLKLVNIEKCNLYVHSLFLYNIASQILLIVNLLNKKY